MYVSEWNISSFVLDAKLIAVFVCCEYDQDKETEVQTPAWVRLRQSSVENFIFIWGDVSCRH